jgi:hypothetical protein
MPVDSDLRYSSEDLRRFTVAAFEAVGMPAEDAALTADHLIQASRWGADTHSITHVLAPAPPPHARGRYASATLWRPEVGDDLRPNPRAGNSRSVSDQGPQ